DDDVTCTNEPAFSRLKNCVKNLCSLGGNDRGRFAIIPRFHVPARSRRGEMVLSTESDGRIMPKQKTHKGLRKRFKVTASGKAKHRSAYRGHKFSHKSPKRK